MQRGETIYGAASPRRVLRIDCVVAPWFWPRRARRSHELCFTLDSQYDSIIVEWGRLRRAPGETSKVRAPDTDNRRLFPEIRMTPRGKMMPRLAYSAREERRRCDQATDRELLAMIANRDDLALDSLMLKKTALLMQIAYRILGDREEARDVVQVTFLRVWEKASRYDPQWHPNTWLYRIVTNLAIDLHRKRMRNNRHQESFRAHYLRLAEDRVGHRPASLEHREIENVLEEILGGLSERQRLVFVLSQQQGLNSKEVGLVLGCRPSTVRNHLLSARRKLRASLHARFPEYAAKRSPAPDRESTA